MLVMNPGSSEEQYFPLAPGTVTIGRTKDNAILCLHKSLSRTHARIVYDGRRVEIADLQSKNGVFVRGRRVERFELGEGDEFRCGDVSFLLVGPEDATDPSLRRPDVLARRPEVAIAQTMPSPFAVALERFSSLPPKIDADADARHGVGARHDGDARHEARLAALIRVTEIGVAERDVDALLQAIVARVTEVLPLDRICVLEAAEAVENGAELRPRVVTSFASATSPPYSRRVVARVVASGNPASLDDVACAPSEFGEPTADHGITSAIGIPLDAGRGLLGVLYVDRLGPKPRFDDDDRALLRAVANVAALALDAAKLRAAEAQGGARLSS